MEKTDNSVFYEQVRNQFKLLDSKKKQELLLELFLQTNQRLDGVSDNTNHNLQMIGMAIVKLNKEKQDKKKEDKSSLILIP